MPLLPGPRLLTVEIVNLQKSVRVPGRKIRRALKLAFLRESERETRASAACRVNVVVVGDREMAELNGTYLGRKGPTDVLAFPPGDDARTLAGQMDVMGEIVISAERAREEARRRRIHLETELIHYAVHGMLHLLGYDDGSRAAGARMRRRETELLRDPGLPARHRTVVGGRRKGA
jgi:probable rRNA maturation factor